LAPVLKAWARKPWNKAKVHVDFRRNGEVRLAPINRSPSACFQLSGDGCTLLVREGKLHVACSKACAWIEEAACRFLRARHVITVGVKVIECPVIPRRFPRPFGHPRLAPLPPRRPRRKKIVHTLFHHRRFRTVLEAVEAARRDAGVWLIFTERALRSAADSDYNDPDYIYEALMALALAAKTNASGLGLGMSWTSFLHLHGSHDFTPHSSGGTLQRFRKSYVVMHDGVKYLTEAHIRCGTGAGSDSARIYVAQPERPGRPVIVGQVGRHSPIETRPH